MKRARPLHWVTATREHVTAFAAAIQFLLVSPAFVRRVFTPKELGHATGFYPLAGLILGAALAFADFLIGQIFPMQVRSALVLALWVVLTGALHFDGFVDACDGLIGGATPERRMEIMRDEHIGAYALAGGALMLLTLFSALSGISHSRWAALVLAPVLGRWGVTLAVVKFPYARPAGLGRDLKDHARIPQAVNATLTALLVITVTTWMMNDFRPVVALLSSIAGWWLGVRFVLSRIPGMTGDTYGALNMIVEATVLLTFNAMQ